MALNLNTLTSPATSADVLAEVLTTADFLEPVPVLRNLSRGSNKGGDAKQDVALNQPKALPLIDGDGYLYCPSIGEQGATVDSPVLPSTGDFDIEIDFIFTDQPLTNQQDFFAQYNSGATGRFFIGTGVNNSLDRVRFFWQGTSGDNHYGGTLVKGQRHVIRVTRIGTAVEVYLDGTGIISLTVATNKTVLQVPSRIGHSDDRGQHSMRGAIFSVTEGSNFECDFNATNVRHNDTKFKCATGQVVTINQSGNDPATVIKKSVLRFANTGSTNIGLAGLFNQTITDGYMFAAFSVLGNGGESHGRLFSGASLVSHDVAADGFVFRKLSSSDDLNLTIDATVNKNISNTLTSDLGDYVLESRFKSGDITVKINGTVGESYTDTFSVASERFNIGEFTLGDYNAAFDLEYLALFPSSITDAQADSVRNYINNRNNVFDLKDGFGYYFFDPLSLAADAPVSSWNGQIIGSDNDANLTVIQNTDNSQPDRLAPDKDGMVVRFNDNNDHLIVPSDFVEPAAGSWQVVGTSLGTFAYRVNANAVTELNLLGNLGHTSYRFAGDLYGVILLPESATGADIEQARKLLIDRGAADGTTTSDLYAAWYQRDDIVEFKHTNTSGVTSANDAWNGSGNLAIFPPLDLSFCGSFTKTWKACSALTSFPAGAKLGTEANNVNFDSAWKSSGLTSFPALDLSKGNNFNFAFNGCSSLTSFPSNALLGTEANNVSFTSAWKSSGLTSFPALDLSKGTNFTSAWRGCTALTSFPVGANLGTAATGTVNFTNAWKASGLTSFSTPLPTATAVSLAWIECSSLSSFSSELPLVTNVSQAWQSCTSLTSFNTELPLAAAIPYAWFNCSSMTDFSADVFANWNPSSISTGVFNNAWANCTALTAQSVENILTSIDASGKYGTATGAAGGGAIDSGIDIDYDGTTLSAATNSAIDSLIGKGWEVYINGVLTIPNVLTLQPAAAYSLRSFDSDADPNVVRVRRSSDGALSNFKASEVSDGTLTSWVNTEYETVVNGEFATDSDWGKGSGWDIANGKATCDGTQTGVSYLNQIHPNMGASQNQRVTLVVSGYVAGTVRVRLGNSAPISSITPHVSSNGTHVFTLPSHSNPSFLFIEADATFQGSIESISVVQLTSDGQVTTWYDQGGTNHAAQTDVAYMPKIVDAGTLVTEGGLPAVDFDGINDYLESSGYIVELSQNPASVFAVAKPDGSEANGVYLLTEGDVVNTYSSNFILNGPQSSRVGVWVNNTGFGSSITHLNQSLTGFIYDGSTFQAYIDGATNGSSGTATVNPETSTNTYIGSAADGLTGFFNGKVSEIVTFKNDQSANRTGIETNINSHFTIYS